jgi:hypothetical protein
MSGNEPAERLDPDFARLLETEDGYVFSAPVREFLTRADVRDRAIPVDILPTRAFNGFRRNGLLRLGQLAPLRVDYVLGLRNLGVKTVFDLRRALSVWARAVAEGSELFRGESTSGETDALAAPQYDTIPAANDANEYMFSAPVRELLSHSELADRAIPDELLSVRGFNAFRRNGLLRLGQLAPLRAAYVLGLRNVGVKTVAELRSLDESTLLAMVPEGLGTVSSGAGEAPDHEAPEEETQPAAPESTTLDESLPSGLQDELRRITAALERVSARDTRFGAKRLSDVPMSALLSLPVAEIEARGVKNPAETLGPRLALLAERVVRPIPLIDELAEVLPGDERWASVCRSRWGWDGRGPKTLEETGREFGLTRERIRQILKKSERRTRDISAYLPTAEAVVVLLKELGGAAYESDLAVVAAEHGLVNSDLEVGALESLSQLGFISEKTIRRFHSGGEAVLSLGEQDTTELQRIEAATRRILGRRGIAAIAEVVASLEADQIPVSEGEVRAHIERMQGVEYIGARRFFWRPEDPDSAFVRRLEKPLVVLGSQMPHALGRVLRRGSRNQTYGPVITRAVLAEALARSPFFRQVDDDRWAWSGPTRPVPLGIAEAPLVELLRSDGPALAFAEIRSRLIDIEGVTLALALSHSPLVERVSHAVYALTGTALLPGDVEEARRRARNQVPAVQLVDSGWEGGAVVVRWDVIDRRLWNGVLNVPTRAQLQGRWELRTDGRSLITTVGQGALWGGIGIWLSDQKIQYPARLTLRFHLGDRHIDPEIFAHDMAVTRDAR